MPREYTPEEYEAGRAALGAKALDDLTLQIDLTNPAPYYHTLAYTWVFFPGQEGDASRKIQTTGGSRPENHIGNGPFTVTGIDEDQEWTFAANDNYWQGRPKLDGIEYVYIEDGCRCARGLSRRRPRHRRPRTAADPRSASGSGAFRTVRLLSAAATYNLAMNLVQEPFTDKKVREAFSYAFDRETLCAEIRSGDCSPTLSWIPQGLPGAIETDKYALRPRGGCPGTGRILVWRAGKPPRDHDVLQQRLLRASASRSEWVAGQIPRHSRRRANASSRLMVRP